MRAGTPAVIGAAVGIVLAIVLSCPLSAFAGDRAGDERDDQDQLDALDELPPLRFASDDTGTSGVRRELVGLFIAGRERAHGIEVLRMPGDRLAVPLRALARELGVQVVDQATGLGVETPLGPARFDIGEYRQEGGEVYLLLERLARRLALVARFDESGYALHVDPAWPIGDGSAAMAGSSARKPIRPDRVAPGVDLSRLRGELTLVHDERETQRFAGRVEAGGRLGPGTWQLRAQDSGLGSTRIHDYHWRIRHDAVAGMLGHQVIGVHAVLPGFDLTGAQAAWTNAPDRLYSPLHPDLLVADRPGPVRTLRGEGPPGGFAELVVEGRVVDRQRIRLDGIFEFVSVPVPPGQVQIEVLLYERAIAGVPSGRIDFSGWASDRLLGAGEFVVHGGIGQHGNPLDPGLAGQGTAGFLRARRAMGQRITAEAAMQSSGHGDYAMLAADADLGLPGTASAALARGNGAGAWLASLDGGRGPVFWRGFAQHRDAGFDGSSGRDLDEYSLEAGWRHWPAWEVSLLGRKRSHDGHDDIEFIKPAARWRPAPGLYVQARPDYEGQYVFDGAWQPHRDWRLSARRDRRSDELQLEHAVGESLWLTAASARDRELERRRDSILASWQEPAFGGWRVEAGVLHSAGRSGFLARAGRELLPGMQFRIEALRDPLYEGVDGRESTVASLSVMFDLGRAGGRFTRGGAVRPDTGSIGGSVAVAGAAAGSRLEGIMVRVDGQPRARTDAAGRFHVGGLPAGIYRVELDEERLPMELVSRDRSYWAEVAAGAATSVGFQVELSLGVAGRVHTAAPAASGLRVQAVNDNGTLAADTAVDDAGWYRLDALTPGTYRLQLVNDAGETLAEREMQLIDRFLFEQDFQWTPAATAAEGTS